MTAIEGVWSRRQILSGSAGLLLGSCSLGWQDLRGQESLEAGGLSSHVKFSLAAYSYRDLLTGAEPQLSISDFIRDAARFGLDGVELTSYYLRADADPSYFHELRRTAFRLGLDVSGTAVGNDFGFPPGEERTRQIDSVKAWVDRAVMMGAPVIRIFAGHPKPGTDEAEAHRLMVSAMEECCEYAGSRGIHLALENHGGPTATPAGLLSLVNDVQSPWIGINLDTGNFHGADVYAEIAEVASLAINVQVKVSISPGGGPKQPADLSRVAGILRSVGYRGYVVLEYEDNEEPRSACERHLSELREAFAS